MRSIIAVAAFAIAGMAAGTIPASASECRGSAQVCGHSHAHKAHKSKVSHKASHAKHAHRSAKRSKHAQRSSKRRHVASGGRHSGMASYYWQGQKTASGARFNPNGLTAAHRSLPFGTRVRVTNRNNGRSVVVIINDRGPFIAGRIIDLSRGAAKVIAMTGSGVAPVSIEILGRG